MKRNKWQRLAAIGLCGSLLVNAFSGVTAVAETVTIESSPTAESSVKEETQVSSETQASSEATTETSREEVTQETEKQAEVAVEKKEDTPVKAEQEEAEAQQETQPTPQLPVEIQNRAIGVKAGNLPELHQQLVNLLYRRYGSLGQLLGYQTDPIPFPEAIIGFNLKNTENVTLNMADFDLTATTLFNVNEYSPGKPISSVVGPTTVNKSATGFDLVVPAKTITATSNLNQIYYLKTVSLQVPAYIKQVAITGSTVRTGYGDPTPYPMIDTFTITPTDSSHYDISSVNGKTIYQIRDFSGKAESPTSYYATSGEAYVPANDIDLNVIFRKVTENFVDATGAKITAPTGFTQGQQTSITSNNFTYTSAKALPDMYTAGGKTYKFKGWYKGTDKTALKTTKTPSYAVTYDDQDDMTAVYEDLGETKTYNLPAKDVYFGYVDEAGNLLNPADFTVEAELGESTATESSVLGKVQGTNQVTSKLKKLSIPGKSYDFPVAEIKTYGTRYVNHTIPKRYKTMSITPLATYTGDKTKYPIAKEIRKDIEAPYTLVSQVDGEVAYNLSSNGNVFGIRSVFWSWDTNKTPYAMGIYSGRVGKTYNLASPDGTIYYYLENRRVTENFVDATGAKITPPTGFTQGNKIVIDSDNFTYTSAKALPDTYKIGGKTYKFKGWYKGTDKTALKTTKTPSYAVTYDDQDDMTAVYEDLGETTTLPAQTFKFSFVDEQGNLVNPSKISLKGKIQEYVTDETPKIIGEITGKDNGMVKEYTIPEKVFYGVTDTRFSFYGAKTSVFTIPKYYKSLAKSPGTYYSKTAKVYPVASIRRKNFITDVLDPEVPNDLTYQDLFSMADPTRFSLAEARYNVSPTNTRFTALGMAYRSSTSGFVIISNDDNPTYYYLENRRVTENFVDATGAEIAPPTGFTQGNKIVIDSDNFTYTSAKALSDTYRAGGKTYKYKGTDKTALKTTKTPSYAVTYDDKDDMTAVYEEVAMVTLPGYTYQFGFVGEAGQLIDPAKIGLTYDMWAYEDKKETFTEKSVKASDNGNLKEMKIEDRSVVKPTAETAGQDTIYSPVNLQFTLPKYYQKVTPSDGKNLNYPVPQMIQNSTGREENLPVTEATFALKELQPYTYGMKNLYTNSLTPNTPYPIPFRRYTKWAGGTVPVNIMYSKISPIYYMLENRRVTENFVDATGAKITPPTGFTQGKQTVIDSENFTYTSAKALPATYTVGDKNYRFKGWYKGTDKTALKTTKTPSYAVTYDNKDDMTAVYEEVQETTVHPGFYAEFVDEQGKAFTNPLTLSGNYTEFLRKNATSPFEATGSLYPMAGSKEATVANRYKVETKQNVLIPNNYELLPDPATGVLNRGFALNNFGITNELKYVDKVEATTKTITLYDYDTISDIGTNLLSDAATTSLNSFETTLNKETNNTFSVKAKWGRSGLSRDILPNLLFLTSANSKPRLFGFDGTSDYKQTINYKITRKQVTENFVDATGAKITPPTGFTQGKQTPMTSNSFTYTSANALPDKYTAGGKAYQFKGWYKGTDQTALKTTKTPSYAVTYDDKDDMTAVYEEVQPTAEMTVSRLLEVIPNEASMVWTVSLKNTSEVPLTNVKLAPTAKWAAGISAPTQLAVRISNTPNKIIPVTAEQWQAGVNLDIEIPVNGEALVTVGTAKITGEPRQLLTAEMTASGNFSAVTASNFVRIQGEDQTITPAPVEEGFISTPTFDFGKITISSSAKQYGLKKAADYYGNGTRNPYLRIKTDQPNWQLTAQLSQLKASTDSLPTSTRLLLGNADVAAIENYNQVTESTNKVGVTKALTLTSDGTSTPVVLNNQFTGNDVYQLDFDFASVKLDVPANQGKINEKYQGTVTWNLVTGP